MNQAKTLNYIKKCPYKSETPGRTWHEQKCLYYKDYCYNSLQTCDRMRKYFEDTVFKGEKGNNT